jgi:hypothetical protein
LLGEFGAIRGLPDAELRGFEVVAIRGEAVGAESLERGGVAIEEGPVGLCTGVWAAADADAVG